MNELEDLVDDYDYWDEEVESVKDMEMQNKGFHHITNFSPKDEHIYRQAAVIHGLEYSIEDECYDLIGREIFGLKAFYVSNNVHDLSDFWVTFKELELAQSAIKATE